MGFSNSNKEPLGFIDDVVDRLSEIIWWNRNLTKLENEEYFSNYQEIISDGLVNRKGPFIEYIPSPLKSDDTFHDFSDSTHLDDILKKSFDEILFKERPKKECYLFEHQERAHNKILNNNQDVVISVPTGGGKTEAFMLPILQSCLDEKKDISYSEGSLNTIILYPMKSLAVDQFNRFLRYINKINKYIEMNDNYKNQLRIALWDGDTPESVGMSDYLDEGGIEPNSPIRGLLCPECGKKLLIDEDDILSCEDCGSFVWAHVTRKSIKSNAEDISILLTNPESLDYMFINKNERIKQLLGAKGENTNLKNIVLDEAHTWRGIQGAHINLLSKRLRVFYKSNNPKFVLVSATIKDPELLAKNLVNSKNPEVIESEIKTLPEAKGEIDFSVLENKTTTFEDVVKTILFSNSLEDNYGKFKEKYPELSNALRLCEYLNLITIDDNQIKLNEFGKDIWERCDLVKRDQIINNPDQGVSNILAQSSFISEWRNLLEEELQEVIHLARFIAKKGKVLNFEKAEKIISWMKTNSSSENFNPDEILATCLSLGRAGGLLTDKYHIFLKPNNEIYYCEDCKRLSFNDKCRCGKKTFELNFCKGCNTPVMIEQPDVNEREESQMESLNENKIFPKIKEDEEIIKYKPVFDHDFCEKNLNDQSLLDSSVYYPAFTSYILSALSRNISSNKVLSFCDSRNVSETVGKDMINNDYSISVQQMALSYIINNENKVEFLDLRQHLTKEIKKNFYYYFYNNVNSMKSKEILKNLESQNLYPLGYPWKMKRLMNSCLIVPNFLEESLENDIEGVIAQEMFKIFYSKNAKFQKSNIEFVGLTPSKVLSKLSFKGISEETVRNHFWNVFYHFIKGGAIKKSDFEKIKQKISDRNLTENKEQEALDFFENEKKKVEQNLGIDKAPLWVREKIEESTFEIKIPNKVGFCETCISFFPILDESIEKCPHCAKQKIIKGDRLENKGILPKFNEKNWPYDHWANELLYPVVTNETNIYPVVGIHRAGIPMELRSIIEEGFRQDPPKVNVVSSTPTYELGIDIGTLDSIVQVGVPPTLTNYVQRAGRTGRSKGRPSYVFTVLRNLHAVDNYYYENLEEYFRELKENKIPNPDDLPLVKIPHIITSALTFISRNASKGVYENLYEADDSNFFSFCESVKKRAKYIEKFVTEEGNNKFGDKLPEKLISLYGDEKLINDLFENEKSSVNIYNRTKKYFERLRNADSQKNAKSNFANTNKWLGQWLSQIGYFSSYRGFGESVPISHKNMNTIESKEMNRVIREAFPGPLDSNNGGIFSLEGGDWKVKEVISKSTIDELKICKNDNCRLKYQAYPEEVNECVGCDNELELVQIVSPDEIKISNSYVNGETYPIISYIGKVNERLGTALEFLRLDNYCIFGSSDATYFTPAFYWSRRNTETPSEAKIIGEGTKDIDENFFVEGETEEEIGHIGYKVESEGVEISFNFKDFSELYENKSQNAAATLEQAIRKSVGVITESELSDFSVNHSFSKEKVKFHIFDKREGGTGISKLFWQELNENDGRRFRSILKDIATCDHCSKYCDSCLLLDRTPKEYLRDDLLDKNLLKMVVV